MKGYYDAIRKYVNTSTTPHRLKGKIWLDDYGVDREVGHNQLRLKYGNVDYGESVTITFIAKGNYTVIGKVKNSETKYIKEAIEWVDKNYDLLISFYNNKIDIIDFTSKMKTI